MRIAVDVDGVLADRIPAVLEVIRDRYGVDLDAADITGWDATVPHTGERLTAFFEETDRDPDHILSLSLVEGALEGMAALAEDHELLIATYRKPAARESTIRWLEERGIPFDGYARDVGDGKRNVSADLLVEDSARTARAFADERGRAVLFRRPWNADATLGSNVEVVDEWSELVRYVASLSTSNR